MLISGIASGSLAAVYTQPVQPHQQQVKAPQKAPVADTVTISKQAQQLASDGDTQAKEIKEGGAEKTAETLRGKA